MINVCHLSSLINTIFNDKKLCFCRGDVNCVVMSLNDGIIEEVNVSNRGCHLILDAYIRNYNSCFQISQSLEDESLEFVSIYSSTIFAFLIQRIKQKMTRNISINL